MKIDIRKYKFLSLKVEFPIYLLSPPMDEILNKMGCILYKQIHIPFLLF